MYYQHVSLQHVSLLCEVRKPVLAEVPAFRTSGAKLACLENSEREPHASWIPRLTSHGGRQHSRANGKSPVKCTTSSHGAHSSWGRKWYCEDISQGGWDGDP